MDDGDDEDSEDDDEYDLSPDELDNAMGEDSDEESDELDDVENPRVTEVDSEEEAPKLVETKKGKNKRSAEEAASLDDLIAQAGDDTKLSKKQQKKLKNNKGEAVAAEEAKKEGKADKKVQFAKNLEQGPTGSAEKAKAGKGTVGVKNVQGVTVDDRTIGSGRTVKNGDTVGVRYIGKLQNGKQFDGKLYDLCSEIHIANTVQPTRRASPSPSRSARTRSSRAGTLVSLACPSAVSVA